MYYSVTAPLNVYYLQTFERILTKLIKEPQQLKLYPMHAGTQGYCSAVSQPVVSNY